MTQLDVMYSYGTPPTEAAAMALGRIREVYGIRALAFDEQARTVRVEYDATRLSESTVHQLLRRSGLDITGQVSLLPPQPEPTPAPVAG
jgi:hypothetical protein